MALNSGLDNARVVILFGFTLFTSGIGVSGYIYNLKTDHDKVVADIVSQITLERERRADNELLVMQLEGRIIKVEMRSKARRIRMENYLMELTEKITDNRINLSDWHSHQSIHHSNLSEPEKATL